MGCLTTDYKNYTSLQYDNYNRTANTYIINIVNKNYFYGIQGPVGTVTPHNNNDTSIQCHNTAKSKIYNQCSWSKNTSMKFKDPWEPRPQTTPILMTLQYTNIAK